MSTKETERGVSNFKAADATANKPTPYGGDNRPSGEVEEYRVVDVFLDRAAAERLHRDLGVALAQEGEGAVNSGEP